MSTNRILALSSSREGNSGYLETAIPHIQSFLGLHPLQIAFIPFAAVGKDNTEYLNMVKDAFAELPYNINLVTASDAKAVIENADVIMTGGGNTFKLLHDIYAYKLLDVIRNKVNTGTPYIGWSAGSNITGPTIGTTNDMPITEPQSFNALGLFPFQINPHYYNKPIEGFNGETRDQRLMEFTRLNPGISIVGLPEGTGLQLENGQLKLIGGTEATLFYFDKPDVVSQKSIEPGSTLTYLM